MSNYFDMLMLGLWLGVFCLIALIVLSGVGLKALMDIRYQQRVEQARQSGWYQS